MARSKRKRGKPSVSVSFEEIPTVRKAVETDSDNARKISWQLGAFDLEGPWGAASLSEAGVFEKIYDSVRSFESMSWNELPQKQHHSIKVESLNKVAIDRLSEIEQDDVDEIFSLRLQGQHRIYGIRSGAALKAIWLDLNHGDNNTCVCRSRKKGS